MANESWQSAWVEVLPDFSNFRKAANTQIVGTLGRAGDVGGQSFGKGFFAQIVGGNFLANIATNVVSNLASGIATGIQTGIQFGLDGIQLASGLGEQVNAVQVQFGDLSDEILSLAKEAPKNLNLTQVAFNKLAVRFASFAKTVAGKGGKASDVVQELTQRGADFASVYDIEVEEALTLFQSGLAGETEPLRRFGLDLSAARVQAYAYANGIAAQGAELTEAQKIQARYGTLLEQTNSVTGDLANTSDSLANRQRALSVGFEEAQTSLGNFLLPAFTSLVGYANESLLPKLGEIIDRVGPKLADAFEKSGPAVEELLDEVTPLVEQFALGAAEDGIPAFIDVMNQIVDAAPEWIDAAKAIDEAWGGFEDFMTFKPFGDTGLVGLFQEQGIFAQASAVGDDTGSNVVDGFAAGVQTSDGWSLAAEAAEANTGAVVSSIAGFKPEMYTVGTQGASGFAAGLRSGRLPVVNAANFLAGEALREFKGVLRTGSPSKATREIGQFTGDGFALGMLDRVGMAGSAVAALTKPVLSTRPSISQPSYLMAAAAASNGAGPAGDMRLYLDSGTFLGVVRQGAAAEIRTSELNQAINYSSGGVA